MSNGVKFGYSDDFNDNERPSQKCDSLRRTRCMEHRVIRANGRAVFSHYTIYIDRLCFAKQLHQSVCMIRDEMFI